MFSDKLDKFKIFRIFIIFFLFVGSAGLVITVLATCSDVCLDFDGDGYGNPASSACSYPEFDCDDTNSAITVGVTEDSSHGNCGDGTDNDCDGMIDCDDSGCSSVSTCQAQPIPRLLPPSSCSDGVCDVGETCNNCWSDCPTWGDSSCNESCEECPGAAHENLSQCGCGNGTKECGEECDGLSGVTPGFSCNASCVLVPTASIINCVDDDADGYNLFDTSSCPDGDDCDDTNPLIHPNADEHCDDLDWDCDGNMVNGFSFENCNKVCEQAGYIWTANGDSLNCCGNDTAEANPYEATETTCNDGSDNDCNGLFDEGFDPACNIYCTFPMVFPCIFQ